MSHATVSVMARCPFSEVWYPEILYPHATRGHVRPLSCHLSFGCNASRSVNRDDCRIHLPGFKSILRVLTFENALAYIPISTAIPLIPAKLNATTGVKQHIRHL